MMPPQADANLALEYSTDTRKLQWEPAELSVPRWLALGLKPPWEKPQEKSAYPWGCLGSPQHSPEHDRGHSIDSEEEPDDEHVAVHEHLAILEDGRQSCHGDGQLHKACDEPGHPVHGVVQAHCLHHLWWAAADEGPWGRGRGERMALLPTPPTHTLHAHSLLEGSAYSHLDPPP